MTKSDLLIMGAIAAIGIALSTAAKAEPAVCAPIREAIVANYQEQARLMQKAGAAVIVGGAKWRKEGDVFGQRAIALAWRAGVLGCEGEPKTPLNLPDIGTYPKIEEEPHTAAPGLRGRQ